MAESGSIIPFDRIPDGFAERIDDPPMAPVEPRPAATIVLLRDGADGLELLLMKRNRSAGFVPGAFVFPGGRVDSADASEDMLALIDGLDPDEAARRLEIEDGDTPAIAYYLAALREAFEETGILVGLRSDGTPPPAAADSSDVDRIRDELMTDAISFAEAVGRLECRIAADDIEYIAHWITPRPEPRRYDTRFFAAHVPSDATPIVDPREMSDALWIRPTDALRRCDEGSLPMVFPTIKTIEQLTAFESADEALAAYGRAPVRTILPTLVITPTGIGLEIDED
ncbi:MAG: NUDIX hydrolase [Gemmatimonadota bacterium]